MVLDVFRFAEDEQPLELPDHVSQRMANLTSDADTSVDVSATADRACDVLLIAGGSTHAGC